MVRLHDCDPVWGREEQVTGLAQADIRGLPLDFEMAPDGAQEFDAEPAKGDVLGRRELLPDRARREGGGGGAVARVPFDHRDRAPESRITGEEIGDGAANDAATDHDDVRWCRHRFRLLGLSEKGRPDWHRHRRLGKPASRIFKQFFDRNESRPAARSPAVKHFQKLHEELHLTPSW